MEETSENELLVAVAITGSRKSKYTLRWAMDKFLPEGKVTFKILYVYPRITLVPSPMGNWLPVAQVREEVVQAHRQQIEWKKKKALLPFQQALKQSKVKSDIIVIENDDVAMGLSLEVERLSIRHLVIGASSSSIFSRKNLTLGRAMGDSVLSTVISENAPSYCSVYIVADRKLQNLRPAESEPTEITMPNSSGLSKTITESSSKATVTIGHLLGTGSPSPRNSGSAASDYSTKSRESESHQKDISTPKKVIFTGGNKSISNISAVSQSSSSGDSESWVFERTSLEASLLETQPHSSFLSFTPPGGSSVGTPPGGSFVGTPPGGSFVGTPPGGSYVGTPPGGSYVGTPPGGSYVGTPPTASFSGTTPPGSFVGTPPAVSSADITPPHSSSKSPGVSFAGLPPSGHSAGNPGHSRKLTVAFDAGASSKISELEKVRMELQHIEKMYELAQNNIINEKLNDLRKERWEEALKLKEEELKKLPDPDIYAQQTKNTEEEGSGETAKKSTSQRAAEKKAARVIEENENRLKQLFVNPVAQYQKFSWEEILEATSSFSENFRIGAGAFGIVYKCKLHHTLAAVKVLNAKDAVTNKQFLQELEILSTIRHPHLLLLLGAVPEQSCLIYEYMENGSLEDRLFRKNNEPPLPWYDRFRICWEVAGALAFLHSTKPRPIIHRDLKPANILLDQHLVSKIGDAGLGTMINVEPTNESLKTQYKETSPVGTLCYIDPEYQRTGRVSTKSDIYALGVVILQLLTAKPAVGIAYLVEDAIDEDTLTEILDPEAGKWPEEAHELAALGLQCVEMRGRDRPDLQEKVLPALERFKEVADRAREKAASAPASMPSHFICPIRKDIMDDPYVAADGYTYDRAAIELWLAENNTSPTTNLPLPHKFIMPNYTLLEAIKKWKSKQPHK